MNRTDYSDIPLYQFVEKWLEGSKKLTVKTATYSRLVSSAHVLKKYALAQMPVGQIRTEDFHRYVAELVDDGCTISTVKKQMLIVSAPMRYAFEQQYIPLDPCKSVKLPCSTRIKKQSKEVVAYTKDEQEKLLAVMRKHEGVQSLCLEFIMETGLRPGEALALTWSDVNLDEISLKVHATVVNPASKSRAFVQESPKSKSSNRRIPLSVRAVEILQTLKQTRTSFWVFERDGDRLGYQNLLKHCRAFCDEANVKFYGIHVFRHTFATNLYHRDVDVKILSKILGHASSSITYDIYIHLYGDGFNEMLSAVR